jgi:hypothetical protein
VLKFDDRVDVVVLNDRQTVAKIAGINQRELSLPGISGPPIGTHIAHRVL